MAIREEFRNALRPFDGKATSILTEARARFRSRTDYLPALVVLAGDEAETVSCAATWLIKHELEQGWTMPRGLALAMTATLDGVTAWHAQLHMCQSAHLIDLPPETREVWREWLMPLLSHDRPFLRAWALDALCHLAALDDAYEPDAESYLLVMKDDPAASVRARVRNIMARRATEAG